MALPEAQAGGDQRRHRAGVLSGGARSPTSSPIPSRSTPRPARSYIPPQPIHWFDADGHFHPHVYALKGKRDLRTFKLSYAPDPSDPRDLVLFGAGYPYELLGLIPTDRHLLGVADGQPQDALFLLGTDQLGATSSPAWCSPPGRR